MRTKELMVTVVTMEDMQALYTNMQRAAAARGKRRHFLAVPFEPSLRRLLRRPGLPALEMRLADREASADGLDWQQQVADQLVLGAVRSQQRHAAEGAPWRARDSFHAEIPRVQSVGATVPNPLETVGYWRAL